MSEIIKALLSYSTRKRLLDIVKPNRPGIGPVLRNMDRSLRTVFDIGANVGDVSLLMLYYFPQATVYSFEPCADTYRQLTKNIGKSGYGGRSKACNFGFYDVPKEANLNITSFHGANSMLELTDEYRRMNPHIKELNSEKINLVRLDDYVTEQGIGHIDLVKIDVEGVEKQILDGGVKTFSTMVETVVMEISFVRNSRETGEYIKLFQMMHDYGFAPAVIYDLEHSPVGEWRLAQFDCVFRKFR